MLPNQQYLLTGVAKEHIAQTSALGLTLQSGLDQEAWSRVATRLALNAREFTKGTDTLCAWLGDLLNYREGKYRGQIAELAQAAGLHPTTLRNAKLVCSRIPVSCRRDGLSWSHHCEIGKAFTDAQDIMHWLKVAAEESLCRTALRDKIRDHRKKPELATTATTLLATENFALLRELRAAERLLEREQAVWKVWSPETCRLALTELSSLVHFLDAIRNHAGKIPQPIEN